MHRWFFANEREACEPVEDANEKHGQTDDDEKEGEAPPVPTTDWPFCVTYDRPLEGNEYIAITGNCDELGNWDPKNVYLLGRSNCTCTSTCGCRKFEAYITIPRNIDVEYRYCVVAYDPLKDDVIIRSWEVHLKPRVIRTCQNMLKDCDQFGIHKDEEQGKWKVDRGWATTESYVHFKIFNAPFLWQGQRPRTLYTHIEPMFRTPPPECPEKATDSVYLATIEKLKRRRQETENLQNLELAYTEVTNLIDALTLAFQPSHGARCGPKDLVMYHCSINDFANTLYRLDLYTFGHKAGYDEPAYHYGYGFVQPEQLKGSEGYVRVKITCASTHRPLIEMCIRYLIIRPLPNFRCDMKISYERYWHQHRLPLDIGHRGTGPTYRHENNVYRENTLFAFKNAFNSNADMVELDVQLSKDAEVVVFHDHVLHFLMQRYPRLDELLEEKDLLIFPYEKLNRLKLLKMGGCKRSNYIDIAFEAFTYEQLKLVRALRFADTGSCEQNCDRMLHEQLPFVLLKDLLNSESDALPESLGLNIEIKFTQLDATKRWEGGGFRPTFDRNYYVDTILELVLEHAGRRRIIFSCFDADTCAMVRFKQNRYPVVLLYSDPDAVQYLDIRLSSVDNAMYFAHAMEFFALALNATSLEREPYLVTALHALNLQAMSWGNQNAKAEVRDWLKHIGAMGVIYDRINQLDQAGKPLGGILCLLDNDVMRPVVNTIELAEWREKCGYRSKEEKSFWD